MHGLTLAERTNMTQASQASLHSRTPCKGHCSWGGGMQGCSDQRASSGRLGNSSLAARILQGHPASHPKP